MSGGRWKQADPVAVAIWPASGWLPANILRFYVEFSSPAEAVFDRSQLSLTTAEGVDVPDAFLLLNEELWSTDGQRLTVFMEPGRIKRGMRDTDSHDAALVPGQFLRLSVSTGGEVLTRAFGVLPPVTSPMSETEWHIKSPTLATREPLLLKFDRLMDNALMADEIAVEDAGGRVAGTFTVAALGMELVFHPKDCWQDRDYRLVFHHLLEDVCGNRLGEALDHEARCRQRSRAGMIAFRPI